MDEQQLNQLLLNACMQGDEVQVKKYIDADANIHCNKDVAFSIACKNNDLAIVKLFVKKSLELNEGEDKFFVFFLNAIIHQKMDILKYLMKTKMEMNNHRDYIVTEACNGDNLEIFDILIENADKNYVQNNQIMLIESTLIRRREEVAKHFVVKHGCVPSERFKEVLKETNFNQWYESKVLLEKLEKDLERDNEIITKMKI